MSELSDALEVAITALRAVRPTHSLLDEYEQALLAPGEWTAAGYRSLTNRAERAVAEFHAEHEAFRAATAAKSRASAARHKTTLEESV